MGGVARRAIEAVLVLEEEDFGNLPGILSRQVRTNLGMSRSASEYLSSYVFRETTPPGSATAWRVGMISTP